MLICLYIYNGKETNTKGVEIIPFNITTVRKYTQQVKDYKKQPFCFSIEKFSSKNITVC